MPPHLQMASKTYMPQLDTLRCVAVLPVIAHHTPGVNSLGAFAGMGVSIFFVLSSYLITSALVKIKQKSDGSPHMLARSLKGFYFRRALRIYPIYFLVITVMLMLGVANAQPALPWLVTYTINIKMAMQEWYYAGFAHFWTLAVEHQFYLFWPLLFLAIPLQRSWLAPLGIVAISILYKTYYALSGYHLSGLSALGSTYISTQSNLDLLGLGALLAIIDPFIRKQISSVSLRVRCMIMASPFIYIGLLLMMDTPLSGHDPFLPVRNFYWGIGYAGLVSVFGMGIGGWLGSFLSLGPFRYLGQISYGLYMYHPFFLEHPFLQFLENTISRPVAVFSAYILIFVIAVCSYHFLERPCLRLKSLVES